MPGCVGEGYRPYFENYTVDASIFRFNTFSVGSIEAQGCFRVFLQIIEICNFLSCSFLTHVIFKFLRANGGCLGIWSRRRTS